MAIISAHMLSVHFVDLSLSHSHTIPFKFEQRCDVIYHNAVTDTLYNTNSFSILVVLYVCLLASLSFFRIFSSMH